MNRTTVPSGTLGAMVNAPFYSSLRYRVQDHPLSGMPGDAAGASRYEYEYCLNVRLTYLKCNCCTEAHLAVVHDRGDFTFK